jgi:hypothetical protein
MSAIIWWLESPWQIRAFVFILSFFACFVAPYLYTAGKVGTVATRRAAEIEKGEKATEPETSVRKDEPAPAVAQAPQAASEPEPPAKAEAPKLEAEAPVILEEPQQPEAPSQLVEAPAQQVEAPAPVPPEAAPTQAPVAPFRFTEKSVHALSFPALGPVERREISVTTKTGGTAELEVHILPRGGRASALGARRGQSAYLDSDAFTKNAPLYDAVVCVALGSRGEPISTPELLRRANNGEFRLCGLLARKPYISKNAKLYGLPLAQSDAAGRAVQPVVLIGVKSPKGDLADFAVQRKMIAELIQENKIAAVSPGDSLAPPAAMQPRYVEVKGGRSVQKVKPVKETHRIPIIDDLFDAIETLIRLGRESWTFQDEVSASRQCTRHNRPCASPVLSKTLPAGSRKISRRRTGLFLFPPQPDARRICLKPEDNNVDSSL